MADPTERSVEEVLRQAVADLGRSGDWSRVCDAIQGSLALVERNALWDKAHTQDYWQGMYVGIGQVLATLRSLESESVPDEESPEEQPSLLRGMGMGDSPL